MSYASQADMVNRFGSAEVIAISDRSSAGVIDATVLAAGLADADAEIDPYLMPKYMLPLGNVPKVLSGIACDITRYRLCGGSALMTDEIRNRYQDAVKFLVRISRGEISLGLDAAGMAASPTNTVQFVQESNPVFSRGNR